VRETRDSSASERVLVLHGLWLGGFTVIPLARQLRGHGLAVETFEYASVGEKTDRVVARLRRRMRAHADATVHLVGHSLGGSLALLAAREDDDLPAGRIVCLGSPLRGSSAARGLDVFPGGRWMMGASRDLLIAGIERWNSPREVGVIAGRLPFGLGLPLAGFREPNDGTVGVAETELPGVTDHRVIATTHTGLLFSDEAAALTLAFLRSGRFPPSR
jgi:pimeloyl-ACP methyl ester carboxylesterase